MIRIFRKMGILGKIRKFGIQIWNFAKKIEIWKKNLEVWKIWKFEENLEFWKKFYKFGKTFAIWKPVKKLETIWKVGNFGHLKKIKKIGNWKCGKLESGN